MLSIAVSSGVQAAVVLMDDERAMPYVEGYARAGGFGQSGNPIAGRSGLAWLPSVERLADTW